MSTLAVIATSTLTGVIGAAAMYVPARLALRDARTYRAEADRTFGAAESLADEVERTRNLPWHYAIEAAPEPEPAEHEGEVLHVEHATAELRQLIAQLDATDDDAMDALPAISDRPAEDEDEVGEEQPGEAQSRLLAKLHAFLRWLDDVTDRAHDWLADRLKRRSPEPYRGRHWVEGTQHTGAWPIIPAQRDGGEDL